MTNDSIGSNSVTGECYHVYNCLIYQCCPLIYFRCWPYQNSLYCFQSSSTLHPSRKLTNPHGARPSWCLALGTTVLAWDRRKSIKGDFCFPDWSHSVWEKGESLTALPYIQLMAKENIHFLSISFFQLYLFHQDFIIQLLCDFWYSF